MNLYDLSHPSKKKKQQLAMESRLAEFAADGGGDSGNYFQALASAWYNGTFDSGSLEKGIKSQQDVERLLNRGIVCPDGVTRKLHIDYNSDFNGVEIFSDDYYEHGDHDDTIDSRTGQKWGPYDHMEFSDEELSEGLNEFAPPGDGDGGDDGFDDEMLKRLAAQWWNGDEDPRVERALAAAGWEIGQDEGSYDNGGAFVVQAGDVNGNSYMSWPAEELEQGVAEGEKMPDAEKNKAQRWDYVVYNAKTGAVKSHYNTREDANANCPQGYKVGKKRAGTSFVSEQGVAEGDTVVKHRIGLTVTDPNHPMISKRNEPFQRTVRVPGDDPAKAINAAIAHYRRKGYKVHDHHYMGTVDYTIDEAAPDWLRRTAGAATGALAGVGASFPGAAIAGPVGGAVAGAYGAKAGYDLGAGAADWVYDKVTGKRVSADKAEVDEELTMKHQRAHTTQRRPDISNSLADRDFDMSEKPNVSKSFDGHPTVKWRHHGHAGHTRVEPTLNPTSMQRKDTRPIPSFLKKGMTEAIPLDTLRSTAGTRVKDEVSAKLKQNGPLGREQVSVQQLATISDAALDKAYGYGRSTPGNTFGWQANLKSAAYAKKMIDKGVTDIEAISDAIHKGWNVTAQAFVNDPDQFDDSKTMAPEKLQAKIAQRQKLMTQNYAQLPEDEKEKDRVVARAMLQAITSDQGVAEGSVNDYFKRRKDEEDRIAGTKAPAKRTPKQTDYEKKREQQGVAEGLNEFAPDGFNGGNDGEEFSPEIAKMAQEDGFTKGASLADGATLERAMTINHWHNQHGGMYKQHFVKGFKAGRMNKIRHDNKQYNLNLKLMKDGSIRHGEPGVAEGGYQHGFADPNAPSLGGSRRKDDEGNSEFDDRQRRQTGMIFYNVDDDELAQQLGLKQTRTGKWYLRTGNRHAQQSADRAFGLGRIWYPKNETVESDQLGELSNELLGRYKKELGVRARDADRAGDYDAGHEYFKKINRATMRQGDNDARRHAEKENDMMETRLNMMRKAGYDL